MRTSLFQGALLYTTQIWQHVEKAPAAFHDLMGKSYPPGVHQQMLFEVENGEWVHSSVMSGLTPTGARTSSSASRTRPTRRFADALRGGARPVHAAPARSRTRSTTATRSSRSSSANNHAIEAVITMEEALGGSGHPHPQLVANGMVATVDDPELGTTTQIGVPINLLGTPGAIQGPQPRRASTTTRSSARSATRRARDRRTITGATAMNALEGVPLVDFGQYLAGPFGPMIIGDLGAEVIKVEPVTGDGMRLAGKPFFGCQRGKRDIALDLKTDRGLEIALELIERADIVHHNMTAGVANKLGIGVRRLQGA